MKVAPWRRSAPWGGIESERLEMDRDEEGKARALVGDRMFDEEGFMYPWVGRLLEEHAGLCERIARLRDYTQGGEFPYVAPEQRLAMQWQLQEMQGYRLALEKRLALLGIEGGGR